MELKNILNKLMAARGVSAREVAAATGISYQPIYSILSGKTVKPRGKTLRALAKYFKVTPAQLLGEEPLEDSDIRDSAIDRSLKLENGIPESKPDSVEEQADELTSYVRGEKKVPAETPEDDRSQLRQLFLAKYFSRGRLVIPIAELDRQTTQKIISLLLYDDMGKLIRQLLDQYAVREEDNEEA